MSSAADPIFPVTLFTPSGGGPHDTAHPMAQLPSTQSQPFTLDRDVDPPRNRYSIRFENQLASGSASVRIYLIAFTISVSSPTWTGSMGLSTGNTSRFQFTQGDIGSATNLWVGAWWDDGTYPATTAGIEAYFTAHPSGGGHHTVPIIPG